MTQRGWRDAVRDALDALADRLREAFAPRPPLQPVPVPVSDGRRPRGR